MRAVGVIPARIGSTRLEEKPLLRETGRSLIRHVYENARAARRLESLVVATDDARIADEVLSFGARAVLTPADCPSGTDRVAAVARDMAGDVFVNIQGDEPEMDPEAIDAVVAILESDARTGIATAAAPIRDVAAFRSPHVVKVVLDSEGFALYFSRSPIPARRDQKLEEVVRGGLALGHLGLYGYKRAALEAFVRLAPSPLETAEQLEQLRALQAGMRMRVAKTARLSSGIDTREDYDAFVARERATTGSRRDGGDAGR